MAADAGAAFTGAEKPLSVKGLLELFSQLEVAEAMQVRQLQSLVIEPLQTVLEDARGLSTVPRLAQNYGSVCHDFYDSLNEFLALEGTSAAAAKAHAKRKRRPRRAPLSCPPSARA